MTVKVVEISALKILRNAHRMADRFKFPVLVVGEAGLGKSTAARQVAKETGGAWCEATQYGKNTKGLYRMVLNAYKFRVGRTFIYDLAQECFDYLGPQSGPLFVDEYQTIPPAMLRELLHIQERCELTLVLVGNTVRLARTRATAGALDQIESRIGMRYEVDQPSPGDCHSIGIEYNVEGTDAYAAIAAYGGSTSVRLLIRLLEMCRETQGEAGSIRLPLIKEVAQAQHGPRKALTLLSLEAA